MLKNQKAIPVRSLAKEFGKGIAFASVSSGVLQPDEETNQVHRDDYHVFFILEKGTALFEVDFQKHKLKSSSITYIHVML